MRRWPLALCSGGLAVAIAVGAGTASAPGIRVDTRLLAKPPECDGDGVVTVAWLLAPDIRHVTAVEIGDLDETCAPRKIEVTLLDPSGVELARTVERDIAIGSSTVVELSSPVPAAAIARVEVLTAGVRR